MILGISMVLVALGGCATSPTVATSSPAQVTVKHSFGSVASTTPTADAECKKHDPKNTAVFKTMALSSTANEFIYDCVKK
jgi:hypothetical protein